MINKHINIICALLCRIKYFAASLVGPCGVSPGVRSCRRDCAIAIIRSVSITRIQVEFC